MNKIAYNMLRQMPTADIAGRTFLIRNDFNVPLNKDGVVDNTKITRALPTINHILEYGGAVICMSHLGRPKGEIINEFSMVPVYKRLQELLNKPISFEGYCMGLYERIKTLNAGQVLVLDNLRFHPEEKGYAKNKETNSEFAKMLASYAGKNGVYVDDAFGCMHREHASIVGIAEQSNLECYAGFLVEDEINSLARALAPESPSLAIFGGKKVSGKIKTLNKAIERYDTIAIVGAMAYTFMAAQGKPIGNSYLDEGSVPFAKKMLEKANQHGVNLLISRDFSIARRTKKGFVDEQYNRDTIPDGWEGLDIGPKTIDIIATEVAKANTIVWNGPAGMTEDDRFTRGTYALAQAIAESDGFSIIGGGDMVAAVNKSGHATGINHISTGGGAMLEFLENNGTLPGLEVLVKN